MSPPSNDRSPEHLVRRHAGRLSKRDVETLLIRFDLDPIGALVVALGQLLRAPNATFEELVQMMADEGLIDASRRRALAARDLAALDELVRALNETRTLPS